MGSSASFKRLFEPGRIGGMAVANRIVMSSMGSHTGKKESVTEVMKDYYEARAKAGVGLIILEAMIVDFPEGGGDPSLIRIDDDRFLPGLRSLAEVIHRHGVKAVTQLCHLGPGARKSVTHMQPVAASAILRPPDITHPEASQTSFLEPRELSAGEIKAIAARFAGAAARSKDAGFDGVEIQAAHRYLINSFLSPFWNQRKDEYGGDINGRARFLLEIIASIRQAVGSQFPVLCRINSEERDVKGGITPELARQLAALLNGAAVDAIDLSVNVSYSPGYAPGHNIEPAGLIKQVFNKPVMAVGVLDARLGEKALREKKADFIGIGRSLIADPEWTSKVAEGRLDDIAPCLRCNCCTPAGGEECAVNAAYKKESPYAIARTGKPKHVVIVGGGPAGLEAARVAALRGHRVSLFEKEKRLGGQVVLASVLREENEALIRYLGRQIKKLGVEVHLGVEADSALVADARPDAVILAVGATSSTPDIPGIESGKVLTSSDVQAMVGGQRGSANTVRKASLRRGLWRLGLIPLRLLGPSAMRRILRLWVPVGKQVVIVGMGLPGVELADFLVQRGKTVTIVDEREKISPDEPPMPVLRTFFNTRLAEHGVVKLAGVKIQEITGKGLTIIDKGDQTRTLEADTIMFASEYKPSLALSQALAGKPFKVHLIGDCAEPVGILQAIRAGSRVAREI